MPTIQQARVLSGTGKLIFVGNQGGTALGSSATQAESSKFAFSVQNPAAGVAVYDSVSQAGNSVVLALRNISGSGNIQVSAANGLITISDTSAAGPAGPTGPAGPQGPSSTWRDGVGAPSNTLGVDGDFYLDVGTADVYQRASGTYSIVSNIKGATGPQGPSFYDIIGYWRGQLPSDTEAIHFLLMVRSVVLPQNLTGSLAQCLIAPTSSVSLNLVKNGSTIGTMNFGSGQTTGTYTFASQVALSPGDKWEVDPPNPQDATFADLSWTIIATVA